MPSSQLILCRPLLLLPPIPPSIRVFSNESTLCNIWSSKNNSIYLLYRIQLTTFSYCNGSHWEKWRHPNKHNFKLRISGQQLQSYHPRIQFPSELGFGYLVLRVFSCALEMQCPHLDGFMTEDTCCFCYCFSSTASGNLPIQWNIWQLSEYIQGNDMQDLIPRHICKMT